MDNWLPIESIPMDRTPVLVWLEKPLLGSYVQVARFSPKMRIIGNCFDFDAPKAIRWMPLPDPPHIPA